jgi:hypothetical protein
MGVAGNNSYFYYATTRKLVSVFGAFFNDIYTARKLSDGTLANVIRVPLSYGPRSKFLTRILENPNGENESVSIKLPRMSFQITGISYDSTSKLNSINRRKFCVDGNENLRDSAYIGTPYILTFELNIFSRTQDDALQILEQIIPVFRPEYTVSIKDIEGPGTTSDVPFTLTDITLSDEFEGDFIPARPIIYTLTFTARTKYVGALVRQGIIERAMVNFRSPETKEFLGEKVVEKVDEPKSFISDINPDDFYEITFTDNVVQYQVGENILGESSGYAGIIKQVNNNKVIIYKLENMFEYDDEEGIGENLIGVKSGEISTISSIKLLSE